MNPDNLFVVQNPGEDIIDPVSGPGGEAADANKEPAVNVEDLIPLCVKHATGPQFESSTFGYDIAQMQKRPWSEPGAKLSDYFNYGFSESSWRLYCMMQAEGEASLLSKSKEVLQKLEMSYPSGEAGGADDMVGGEAPHYDHNYAPHGGGGYDGRGYRREFHPAAGSSGGYQQSAGAQQQQGPYNYKTKLCQRFAEGRCTKGSECNYAHGINELRTDKLLQDAGVPRDHPPQGGMPPPSGSYYGRGGPPQQQYRGGAVPPQQGYQQGEGGSGFRMPPKRPRGEQDTAADIYEPQY